MRSEIPKILGSVFERNEQMGITRKVKATALATTILLLGLAAACGGNNGDSSGGSNDLVPQRANVVGSVDIDQFLDAIDLDLEQVFQLLSAESLGGPEGIDDVFNFDPAKTDSLFGDVSRADIFAEADVDGDSEYFGLVLHGSFDETALIAELEAILGSELVQEVYQGINVYSVVDDGDEFTLSVLDLGTFAIGEGGAVKDIIDLRSGGAESATGPMIDVFNDLQDGIFGFAAKVPQDAFDGGDLGPIPGLGNLPISLDFLSSLDIVGIRGDLENGSLNLMVSMDFTNQEAAETLEGFINGFVTLASGFSPDPRTTELLSGLEIDQDGRRLTIMIEIPESELSDIFGDLTTITETTTSGSLPPGTPEIRLLGSVIAKEIAIMPSADHVPEGQKVEYSTTPPTSGMHWPTPAECGWYADGLPDERITHNLEHGNIVVSYNFTNPAQVSELRQVLEGEPRFRDWGVARSYENIPDGQVALSAWGRLATFRGVAAGEIGLFFEAFAGLMGPERIAC